MGNSVTPTNIFSSFNTLIGQQAGDPIKTSLLGQTITVGQAAQIYGYENTLNALSMAMGKVLIGVRPYSGSFAMVESDNEAYGQITRKISYYSDGFEADQSHITSSDRTQSPQLLDGMSTDPYSIRKRYPLEIQFGGVKVLQKSYTRFLSQLKVAFSNAEDFDRFYRGEAIQIGNEIQMMKEAENRALVLNAIAATYSTGNTEMKINLTTWYKELTGDDTITTNKILNDSAVFSAFAKKFVSLVKYTSDLLTKNTKLYHLTPQNKMDDNGEVLSTLYRHTPRANQRLLLASKIWYDAESEVMSSVFHDGYLQLEQAERIAYWQTPADPLEIRVAPNCLDVTTGLSIDKPEVSDIKVIGLLYDQDALNVTYRQNDVLTTPINARGNYYNTVYHWAKDYRYDATENMVLFYMKDEA